MFANPWPGDFFFTLIIFFSFIQNRFVLNTVYPETIYKSVGLSLGYFPTSLMELN